MSKVLGDYWEPILKQRNSTCHFNKPFNVRNNTNILLAYQADNLDRCLLEGSKISKEKSDSKFLFWSFSGIPISEGICGNCFIFKNCDEQNRTSIPRIGNTYRLSPTIAKENGKYTS